MGSSDLPVPWPNTGQEEIKIVAWKVAERLDRTHA